ncbi:hypothetical protein BU24DRAFT_256767 [Aaosphaeria arxii CBS 175.79]|uniref:Transcription factor TFIIIB component B'' Myb domain-containing protein n=1 Tax=Aaosphaeria arxii CBS 175.79 TaxID=1450172 RepID=A0A6A5XK47_9PLEO|nr:uncharacterized protein BU24DRAFT_256767 [Aaosphaeria arxii CBS 175.79]KAF2012674.1 hypothetical protein BU24DRAFT_256767 [Aaosphaeria arxii CBS 175.79]
MSSEGGSAQPPAGGTDKSHALKPAPGFSSFINKSGAGKKFGPKAIRRRPAPPAASTKAAAPSDTQEAAENEAPPDSLPVEDTTTQPVLPTPAASQGTAVQDVPIVPPTAEPLPTIRGPIPTPESTPLSTEDASNVPTEVPSEAPSDRQAAEELEPERPAKRRRTEKAATKETVIETTEPALESSTADSESTRPEDVPVQSRDDIPIDPALEPTAGKVTAAGGNQVVQEESPTTRRRRTLPWQAVNKPTVEEENEETGAGESQTEAPAEETRSRTRAKPKPKPVRRRGKKQDAGADANGADVNGEVVNPEEEADSAPPVAPKTRRTRKTKAAAATQTPDGEAQEGESAEPPAPKPKKKRAPRKKKSPTAESGTREEADGENQDLPPSQRRRAEREATPSDAEDQMIDPGATFMDNLASRNIKIGRLSQRERKMREINWEEVRQRQRAEEALVTSAEARNAVDAALNEAGEARDATTNIGSGPQLQLINGQMVLSTNNNGVRESQLDAEIDMMEEIQEDDLTTRITSRSFMKNDKRHPQEFMLPGQGKRWNAEATEHFYAGLARFGTDFMMISSLFPGTTRRSIKTKFVREERENPARIKQVLNAPRRNNDWESYLTHSGRTNDEFKDTDNIMRELAEEEARMRIEINAAKEVAEEERKQRHAAGIFSDNEDGGDKENGKKKGRKRRGQQAANVGGFALRPGEEIVDDDEMPDF